jgi:hypothetical protein
MRIRRLARDAVFITVAVMVLGGFSIGIAGATSAAPTSSAVTSSSAIHRMLPGCNAPAVCTFDSSIRGLVLIQKFSCAAPRMHNNIHTPIFEIANLCSAQVYWYNSSSHCMSPNSVSAGAGRFSGITAIGVTAIHRNC